MFNLTSLVDMLRRDLVDYDEELDYSFLLGKLVDSAYELSIYFPFEVIESSGYYYIEPNPNNPLKRLISLNAAIDIIAAEYSRLKKMSERISETGMTWSYSVSATVVKQILQNLENKRRELLEALVTEDSIYSNYLNLIDSLKEKDSLATS